VDVLVLGGSLQVRNTAEECAAFRQHTKCTVIHHEQASSDIIQVGLAAGNHQRLTTGPAADLENDPITKFATLLKPGNFHYG
jgi:hypothetical protein